MVEYSVERVQGDQLNIIPHFFPAERKKLFEQKRRGNDGRPAIECEAVYFINVGSAAGLIAFLVNLNVMSFCGQSYSGRESAEPAADNYYFLCIVHIISLPHPQQVSGSMSFCIFCEPESRVTDHNLIPLTPSPLGEGGQDGKLTKWALDAGVPASYKSRPHPQPLSWKERGEEGKLFLSGLLAFASKRLALQKQPSIDIVDAPKGRALQKKEELKSNA
jgi:hypothetical protein